MRCVVVFAARFLNAACVLSNWWRWFLNLVVFCFFPCVFQSCSALSSQDHRTILYDKGNVYQWHSSLQYIYAYIHTDMFRRWLPRTTWRIKTFPKHKLCLNCSSHLTVHAVLTVCRCSSIQRHSIQWSHFKNIGDPLDWKKCALEKTENEALIDQFVKLPHRI